MQIISVQRKKPFILAVSFALILIPVWILSSVLSSRTQNGDLSNVAPVTSSPSNTTPVYNYPGKYYPTTAPFVENDTQLEEFLRSKTLLLITSITSGTSSYLSDPIYTGNNSLITNARNDILTLGSSPNINIYKVILNSDLRSGAVLARATSSSGKTVGLEFRFFKNAEDVWKFAYFSKNEPVSMSSEE